MGHKLQLEGCETSLLEHFEPPCALGAHYHELQGNAKHLFDICQACQARQRILLDSFQYQ